MSISPNQRFGDGRGDETRGWIVIEYGARLADEADHHIASRRWRRRTGRDQADHKQKRERYGAARD
ncbi:MAG: hypothetical protein M3O99_11470 [Chloroflexota bacterium]|nr:hypothetical protein [Chloroflexota bacterium]